MKSGMNNFHVQLQLIHVEMTGAALKPIVYPDIPICRSIEFTESK
jgi:hypothetical protein